MIINGVELPDLDLAELEVAEQFEAALNVCADKVSNLEKESVSRVKFIRESCEAVFEVFETLFGEGTAKKVFGEHTNLIVCNTALAELVDASKEIDSKNAKLTADLFEKYSPERAKR
ncbi:MAG: DUF6673 family protein [Acutalibacteraceae bacterium]